MRKRMYQTSSWGVFSRALVGTEARYAHRANMSSRRMRV